MYQLSGGCYCNNITFKIETIRKPDSYEPRACDCDFCIKHCASYISDPKGSLKITVKNENNLNKYKVGSGIADFLVCRECGVFVGVCYPEEDNLYGSINSKAVKNNKQFGSNVVISPKQLSDSNKIGRWKNIWFSHVELIINT